VGGIFWWMSRMLGKSERIAIERPVDEYRKPAQANGGLRDLR
jgi:hypothetical protein